MAAGRTLLWTLLLCGLHASVSHGPELNVGEKYEVVRPLRLPTRDKRDAESLRPKQLKYALTLGGRPLELHLERNDELLTKDFSQSHYLEDGTRVTSVPDHIDNCYYQGMIVGEDGSQASISTCEGLSGYFRTSAQRYLISPLTAETDGDHAVVTLNDDPSAESKPPPLCGVTNDTWTRDEEPPSRKRSSGMAILSEEKYIELYLVTDYAEFVRMGRDTDKLRKRIFEVVNFVNMAYKPLLTFVALGAVEMWTDRDKIRITSNTAQNLEGFRDWRNGDLTKEHDSAHLISGVDFDGGTVGLAYVGALCTRYAVGVVQDHADSVAAVGATLAHELGHNLGMSHDYSACQCSGESCIMEPTVRSWSIPHDFTSCSRSKYEEFLMSRSVNCLLNKPLSTRVVTPPVCGNGFVEKGELCDCGSVQECRNPCCNAATCQLSEGSQCAMGECCEKCKILPRSRECRRKQDECDSAEYCDGQNAACPEDVFAPNGAPCNSGQGYCFNGECPQRLNQCRKMYGPGAIEGQSKCFDINQLGQYYGYCERPSKDRYIKCADQDKYCGKLFCQDGNEFSVYGNWLKVGNCKTTHFDDVNKDFSKVETGTKCGEGKVCSLSKCVDLETAYRTAQCSAECPGRSTCNHKGECQCQPGWLPPYCDKKDQSYSSVTIEDHSPGLSTPASLFLIPLLAVLW